MSISPNSFNLDPKETRAFTNSEGNGLSTGENPPTQNFTPVPGYQVSVKESAVHGSDVTKTYTGPGAGVTAGASVKPNDNIGWVTSTGNRVTITGTPGAETIELVHHTGAAIQIDADGSIFLIPTGRKGFGINATKGDGVLAAQNRLVIKGMSSITLETEGNLEFNVGKNLFMDVGGDFVLDVKGSTNISSDGDYHLEVTGADFTEKIGGSVRTTIAGDTRTQVAGEMRYDVAKDISLYTDQDYNLNAQKSIDMLAVETSTLSTSSGQLNIIGKNDLNISSDSAVRLTSKDDITIDAADSIAHRSTGSFIVSSGANTYIDATASIQLTTAALNLSATNAFNTRSATTSLNSLGTFNVDAGGAITIDGSTADVNSGSPSPDPIRPIEISSPRTAIPSVAPSAAEYPDANTVVDSMTTARVAPDFPKNANKMSAEEMSRYENEGDTPNTSASGAAAGNTGAGSPYKPGEGEGSLTDSGNVNYDGNNANSVGVKNSYPAPASLQSTSERLSRNVTVGMFPAINRCPTQQQGLTRTQILDNVRHLCYNILDPVIEQFGNKIIILDGLRIGSGGSRHYLGKAVDLRAASRDSAETAMIAKWMVENLAYDRIFLEANHYGSIHIHAEAAPEGSKGARTVLTCQDPKCNASTSGLQLAYAKQGLKKMGFFA
jgi:uncharacterized protein (DUF2345 family)